MGWQGQSPLQRTKKDWRLMPWKNCYNVGLFRLKAHISQVRGVYHSCVVQKKLIQLKTVPFLVLLTVARRHKKKRCTEHAKSREETGCATSCCTFQHVYTSRPPHQKVLHTGFQVHLQGMIIGSSQQYTAKTFWHVLCFQCPRHAVIFIEYLCHSFT